MKKLTILIVLAAVALVVWLVWSSVGQTPVIAPADSTQAITQDLDGIDLGDLDKEFQDIEEGLNQL